MFRFENPEYLWLLLAIPFLAAIWCIAVALRKRNLRRFGDIALLSRLMPDVSRYRPALKYALLLVVLTLLIVLWARPQMGAKISHEQRSGIETIIAIDVSNSMLAEDVVPSRLRKCKMMVESLIDRFTDDKIGLIVFAGEAYVQMPITADYVSAKMFLQDIDPSLISSQGTDIARAIRLAMESFNPNSDTGKAIIIITDGEDHEGGAVEAARAAKERGINVFLLGVGGTKGEPIPTGNGYMKDNGGQVVMTALNEKMCREVAAAGSGIYIHVDNTSDAQEKLNAEISRLQKGDSEGVIYSEYDEQFQAFALLALILLVVEICVLETKNPLLGKMRLFRRKQG